MSVINFKNENLNIFKESLLLSSYSIQLLDKERKNFEKVTPGSIGNTFNLTVSRRLKLPAVCN